jgi:hypothetical protein
MQVKLVVGEREVQLGWEAVRSIIQELPGEDEALAGLFDDLAQSEVAAIREAVAYKASISDETVEILASDPNPDVILALVNNQRNKLSEAVLTQIIQRNWSSVNTNIAADIECYDRSDILAIGKLLAGNSDPSVRDVLAGNSGTPKAIVRLLLHDAVPEVRRKAQSTLSGR